MVIVVVQVPGPPVAGCTETPRPGGVAGTVTVPSSVEVIEYGKEVEAPTGTLTSTAFALCTSATLVSTAAITMSTGADMDLGLVGKRWAYSAVERNCEPSDRSTTLWRCPDRLIDSAGAGAAPGYFFLCRFALMRFRYLCFDIFLRRFLTSEPMQNLIKDGENRLGIPPSRP